MAEMEKTPDNATPPAEEEDKSARDLRIVIVVGIVLAVLVVAYVYNKMAEKPATPATAGGGNLNLFNSPGEGPAGQAKPGTPQKEVPLAERYQSMVRGEWMQSAPWMLTLDDRTLVIARPSGAVGTPADPRFELGWAFDVTKHDEAAKPDEFQRRRMAQGLLFANSLPIIGFIDKIEPVFTPAAQMKEETGNWPVLGLVHGGEAKAYPVRMLVYHEIVNDILGKDKDPVAVTWDSLAYGGVALLAKGEKGRVLFGMSGLMYHGDYLMFDAETRSLWSPALGRCLAGPKTGATLPLLNAVVTTMRFWKEKHPESLVLTGTSLKAENLDYNVDPTIPEPNYHANPNGYAVICGYDINDLRLSPKAMVCGVVVNGVAKAYAYADLARRTEPAPLQDTVKDKPIKVIFEPKGMFVSVTDADGNPIPSRRMFWMFWQALYPKTEVYGRTPGTPGLDAKMKPVPAPPIGIPATDDESPLLPVPGVTPKPAGGPASERPPMPAPGKPAATK